MMIRPWNKILHTDQLTQTNATVQGVPSAFNPHRQQHTTEDRYRIRPLRQVLLV